MTPTASLLLVLGVLALASVLGVVWRARNGRFTPVAPSVRAAAGVDHGPDGLPDDGSRAVTGVDLGVPLGERATYLQLSSEVCAPCRSTHRVLADVAAAVPGVVHVDVDVAQRLDLVRRFDVLRTPTVLVLDAGGVLVGRMSGATTRTQALAALAAVPELDSCPGGVAAR